MFTLFDQVELEQEDIEDVIRSLSSTCEGCRLNFIHPNNRGFIYRGNPLAKIAVIYEAPRDSETERGVALIGSHGRVFETWMKLLNLDPRSDLFITNVVQCQPPRELRNGERTQREPDATEISAC